MPPTHRFSGLRDPGAGLTPAGCAATVNPSLTADAGETGLQRTALPWAGAEGVSPQKLSGKRTASDQALWRAGAAHAVASPKVNLSGKRTEGAQQITHVMCLRPRLLCCLMRL